MTEAEWLSCRTVEPMLQWCWSLGQPVSDRKARFCMLAWCRRAEHTFYQSEAAFALNAIEQWTDGLITKEEYLNSWKRAGLRAPFYITLIGGLWAPHGCVICATTQEVPISLESVLGASAGAAWELGRRSAELSRDESLSDAEGDDLYDVIVLRVGTEEIAIQANLLRDILGNPFRPVIFDPAWRTATVSSFAERIYADRAFADLPILADALEDAGCTSADVLEHCRRPGEHARGCWVVDLVLGKS